MKGKLSCVQKNEEYQKSMYVSKSVYVLFKTVSAIILHNTFESKLL